MSKQLMLRNLNKRCRRVSRPLVTIKRIVHKAGLFHKTNAHSCPRIHWMQFPQAITKPILYPMAIGLKLGFVNRTTKDCPN